MSLRQQAKILGVNAGHLSRMVSGKRPWNPEIKARYESLVGNGFGNSNAQSVAKDSKKDSVVGGAGTYLLGTEVNSGGAEEARTPDPLLAKQVLSQLSYSPL